MNSLWLGNIPLELPEWPVSLECRRGHSFAEHQPVNRAPLLQSTGRTLTEFSIEGRLHRQFGRTPSYYLGMLEAAVAEGTVQTLITSSGKIHGKFVIADMSERVESTDSNGEIDSITVSLTLREYVETDALSGAIFQQMAGAKGLFKEAVEGLRKWLK